MIILMLTPAGRWISKSWAGAWSIRSEARSAYDVYVEMKVETISSCIVQAPLGYAGQ